MQTYFIAERLENVVLAGLGLLVGLLAVYLFCASELAELAKGLRWPLLVLALIATLAGGGTAYQNQQRLQRLAMQPDEKLGLYRQTEQKRMQQVNQWWVPLPLLYTLLILIGLAGYWLTGVSLQKGIWLGVVLLGLSGLFIDGFAHERAKQYTRWLSNQSAS